MPCDLLFNLNQNLEYVEGEFQIDNNPNYVWQRANEAFVNCVFVRCCFYPTPFEGWRHDGKSCNLRNRTTTQGLDQRS